MLELSEILKYSDSRTLVLADEMCSGTETQSAVSIVYTAMNWLNNCGAHWVFTTHYHELAEMVTDNNTVQHRPDAALKGVQLLHIDIEYRDGKIVYTRKLKSGKCTGNYGIEVANYLGLPREFITTALNTRKVKFSRYNSQKLVDKCCMCGTQKDLHTHHVRYQSTFDKDSKLKNIAGNLIILCEKCHVHTHESNRDESNRDEKNRDEKNSILVKLLTS
jgi:DNA mismatch repair protein MutS